MSSNENAYFVPENCSIETSFKEKGSRFIGNIFRVSTIENAEKYLKEIREKYSDATHNCYGYILQNGYKKSGDDGEPSGTAGKPIENAIESSGFADTLIVVTRYYGGTNLGIGGLKRAYGKSAAITIEKAGKTEKHPLTEMNISFGYQYSQIIEALIAKNNAIITHKEFGKDIRFRLQIRKSLVDAFGKTLIDATSGSINIENFCKKADNEKS